MMVMQSFFVPMAKLPTRTAQQKGINMVNGVIYTKPEIRKEHRELAKLLKPHIPDEPMEGPLEVSVTWCFPMTKTSKAEQEWHCVRPDADNITKLLLDVMTHCGFWKDDSQISWLNIQKIRSKQTGFWIAVRQLTEPWDGAELDDI